MSLKLAIQKTIPNMVVHLVDEDEIWASRHYSLYASKDEGQTFKKVADLKVPFWALMLERFGLPSRALRLGVRDLRKLRSGTILVVAARRILRSNDEEYEEVYSFRKGLGPSREGWCEDDEGNCYLAEYFLNNKRNSQSELLKSTDDGKSWKTIRSFRDIRHIHCVQFDPFEQKIWLATGDRDSESHIFYSKDKGKTWIELSGGNQTFRTLSLLFTEDYVYWGSDAPTRQNYIYRYSRRNEKVEPLVAVGGPVHYSTALENGTKLFATTAEGNSEGKSAEWDRKAHIWASEDGTKWEDIMNWEKDLWPYILGFGRVLFPHGNHGNNLYFTTQSLKNVHNMLFCAKLQATSLS